MLTILNINTDINELHCWLFCCTVVQFCTVLCCSDMTHIAPGYFSGLVFTVASLITITKLAHFVTLTLLTYNSDCSVLNSFNTILIINIYSKHKYC